jgi:FKBP-type peptidyl-prolyl cis-trans isomerase
MRTLATLLLPALLLAAVQADEPDPEPPGMKALKSGLKYRDLAAGKGAAAKPGNTLRVHYTGWLAKGKKKFDSSRDSGRPFNFKLGAGMVIKGWDEGLVGMKVGGKRRLLIPAKLGYGARGAGGLIPPNADLVFEVELLGINGAR